MVTRFGKKTTETPAPEVWSYEAIESDDETDQSGGMEEDSEHPRLSPASDFFHQKKGSRHGAGWFVDILGWKKKVELGLGLGELLEWK